MRNVELIPKNHLQCVCACGQIEHGFCLAAAEVTVVFVVVEAVCRHLAIIGPFAIWGAIDQNVMVARLVKVRAGRGNAHACQAKLDHEGARYRRAVLDVDKVYGGAFR